MAQPRTRRRTDGASNVQLKPADPFELIRWLARSQSDPRKAVAELVQNSLDAGAEHVDIRRVRVKGALCVVVRDDGEGVLPEMDRESALRHLATNVGHSRKLGLDVVERHKRVVAGKYGVGLLGFWSIGKYFELRSRVGGSETWALRMEEDARDARIERLPTRVDAPPTFTEAVVTLVHDTATKALAGRRLADYLAAELRGQLLRRAVEVTVHDDAARGLAQKAFLVTPRRFTGERLEVPAEIDVDGFAPLRVELYLARGAERPAIQVACAGTLVADDVASLDALGLATAPWVGRELAGIVDFASFNVPPGTRRGVMPDRAALAFVDAMERLASSVEAELGRLDAERAALRDRDVGRELRRALRGFHRRLPQYDLPRVGKAGDGDAERGVALGGNGKAGDGDTPPRPSEAEEPHLFPPGPLALVKIAPTEVRVAPGGERRVRAMATDADHRVLDDVELGWSVEGAGGIAVCGEGIRPAVTARPDAAVGTTAELRVEARQGSRVVVATAIVTIAEDERDEGTSGIPEPHLVSDADGAWRSRMLGDRWEVNDAHEDYRALRAEGRARVRYLLALLAKEIVLRTSGRPETADALEAIVEVLAHAERNLRGG